MRKAIFLVGGPGSGKDFVLKKALGFQKLKEFKLEQIKLENIIEETCVVISTNAYNFDGIFAAKKLLENIGFDSSMIFVDVTDHISRERLISRNVSESVRKKKLFESTKNVEKFKQLFSNFYIFENNSTANQADFTDLVIFCESFLNLESLLLEKRISNKSRLVNKSIKGKLLKTLYPNTLLTKVQTDRIGDEYSVRNSGIGYPSTVGPFYGESLAEYEPELPTFTSDSTSPRSIPPMEKYSDKPSIEATKSRIKNIKKIAKTCWKGN